jgi:hypothetical protein
MKRLNNVFVPKLYRDALMKLNRTFFPLSLIMILILFPALDTPNLLASFEKGSIEVVEDWFVNSHIVDFSQDFRANMFFNYVNETLGIEFYPRLTLHTEFNSPLNLTGYLSRKIKKEVAEFGIQLDSNSGNITLGLNGSIIARLPSTDYFMINITEGESDTIASYDSILGENISIPINFNPIIISIEEQLIEDVDSISVAITPVSHLEGTITLSAIIFDEQLDWISGENIYFENVSVYKNMSDFLVYIEDISLNFQDVYLRISSFLTTISFETTLGTIKQYFTIDLENVEWEEGAQLAGEFVVFLLDALFDIEDQAFLIVIDKASFPISGVLMVLVLPLVFVLLKRLQKR